MVKPSNNHSRMVIENSWEDGGGKSHNYIKIIPLYYWIRALRWRYSHLTAGTSAWNKIHLHLMWHWIHNYREVSIFFEDSARNSHILISMPNVPVNQRHGRDKHEIKMTWMRIEWTHERPGFVSSELLKHNTSFCCSGVHLPKALTMSLPT